MTQGERMTTWSYYRGAHVFDIKTGFRCNNACVHCIVEPARQELVRSRAPAELGTAEVARLLDEAVASGTSTVVLTGGEITIRPDFEALLRDAAARGLHVLVQTNGRALADAARCAALETIPGISFMISVHGSTPETHDAVTRRPGSFAETCAAIRNLTERDREVTAKLVLQRRNLDDGLPVARMVRRLGVSRLCAAFPHAAGFPRDRFRRVVPRYREARASLEAISQHADAEGLPTTFENAPYCILPDRPAFWRRNSDLHAAAMRATPASCGERARAFDWEVLRTTMKVKVPSCRACVFDPVCEGPWAEYVRAFGAGELVPVDARSPAVRALIEADLPGDARRCTCGRTRTPPLCCGRHAELDAGPPTAEATMAPLPGSRPG